MLPVLNPGTEDGELQPAMVLYLCLIHAVEYWFDFFNTSQRKSEFL